MKLTVKIKLNPDPDSRKLPHETLQRANVALRDQTLEQVQTPSPVLLRCAPTL